MDTVSAIEIGSVINYMNNVRTTGNGNVKNKPVHVNEATVTMVWN